MNWRSNDGFVRWFIIIGFFADLNWLLLWERVSEKRWSFLTVSESRRWRTPNRNFERIFLGKNGQRISNTGSISWGSISSAFRNPVDRTESPQRCDRTILTGEKTNHNTDHQCGEDREHCIPKITHPIKSCHWTLPEGPILDSILHRQVDYSLNDWRTDSCEQCFVQKHGNITARCITSVDTCW